MRNLKVFLRGGGGSLVLLLAAVSLVFFACNNDPDNGDTSYTVTYSRGDVPAAVSITIPSAITVKAGAKLTVGQLTSPGTWTDHTWDGWYSGTTKWTADMPVNKKLILEATYTYSGAQHTVTFDYQGVGIAEGNDNYTENVMPDECVTEPAAPHEPDGYTFKGWSTNKDATEGDFNFTTTAITADTTIYAVWERDTTNYYFVTFYYNNDDAESEVFDEVSVTQASASLTKPDDPEVTGYNFKGWFDNKDDADDWESKTAQSFPISLSDDLKLYAAWEVITYAVTFNYQSIGDSTDTEEEVEYGKSVTKPIDPVDSNNIYTFIGWNANKDATTNGVTFPLTITGDTDLYAIWKYGFEITYNASDYENYSPSTRTPDEEGFILFEKGVALSYLFPQAANGKDLMTIEFEVKDVVTSTGTGNSDDSPVGKEAAIGTKQYQSPSRIAYIGTNEEVYPDIGEITEIDYYLEDFGNTTGFSWGYNHYNRSRATSFKIKITKIAFTEITENVTIQFDTGVTEVTTPENLTVKKGLHFSTDRQPILTRDGYFLLGWFESATPGDGVKKYNALDRLTESLTMYAQWEEKEAVTIKFGAVDVPVTFTAMGAGTKVEEIPKGYSYTYGSGGYSASWVKFTVNLGTMSTTLAHYASVTFTVEGKAGDCEYKPFALLVGSPLPNTLPANPHTSGGAILVVPPVSDNNYTTGKATITLNIDPTKANAISGTNLDFCIYDNSNTNNSTTCFEITNISFALDSNFGNFVPVSDITGVPTIGYVSEPLNLTGTAAPGHATNQTPITWAISEEDNGTTNSTITDGVLTATAAGTVTVTATIENGESETTDFTKDFDIVIKAGGPEESIEVTFTSTSVTGHNGAISISGGGTGFTYTSSGNANYQGNYACFKVDLGENNLLTEFKEVSFTFKGESGDTANKELELWASVNLITGDLFSGSPVIGKLSNANQYNGPTSEENKVITIDPANVASIIGNELYFVIHCNGGNQQPISFTISNVVFVPND